MGVDFYAHTFFGVLVDLPADVIENEDEDSPFERLARDIGYKGNIRVCKVQDDDCRCFVYLQNTHAEVEPGGAVAIRLPADYAVALFELHAVCQKYGLLMDGEPCMLLTAYISY